MVWPQEWTARTVRDVHAAAARGPWAGRGGAKREEQPDARHLIESPPRSALRWASATIASNGIHLPWLSGQAPGRRLEFARSAGPVRGDLLPGALGRSDAAR